MVAFLLNSAYIDTSWAGESASFRAIRLEELKLHDKRMARFGQLLLVPPDTIQDPGSLETYALAAEIPFTNLGPPTRWDNGFLTTAPPEARTSEVEPRSSATANRDSERGKGNAALVESRIELLFLELKQQMRTVMELSMQVNIEGIDKAVEGIGICLEAQDARGVVTHAQSAILTVEKTYLASFFEDFICGLRKILGLSNDIIELQSVPTVRVTKVGQPLRKPTSNRRRYYRPRKLYPRYWDVLSGTFLIRDLSAQLEISIAFYVLQEDYRYKWTGGKLSEFVAKEMDREALRETLRALIASNGMIYMADRWFLGQYKGIRAGKILKEASMPRGTPKDQKKWAVKMLRDTFGEVIEDESDIKIESLESLARRIEKDAIEQAFFAYEANDVIAARELGIKPSTMEYKRRSYGLSKSNVRQKLQEARMLPIASLNINGDAIKNRSLLLKSELGNSTFLTIDQLAQAMVLVSESVRIVEREHAEASSMFFKERNDLELILLPMIRGRFSDSRMRIDSSAQPAILILAAYLSALTGRQLGHYNWDPEVIRRYAVPINKVLRILGVGDLASPAVAFSNVHTSPSSNKPSPPKARTSGVGSGYGPGAGINRPFKNARLSFVPPIRGSELEELHEAPANVRKLYEIMETGTYHPVVVPVDKLPLDLRNLFNIPVQIHGESIASYELIKSSVDEIVFTHYLRADDLMEGTTYPGGASPLGYINRHDRPGNRVVFINVSSPPDLLADADKKVVTIEVKKLKNMQVLAHQIIHEAAHKYVQKLVHEGRLEALYEDNVSWFEKIATTIQRRFIINMCATFAVLHPDSKDFEEIIRRLEIDRTEFVEERIKVCNMNLKLSKTDYSLPDQIESSPNKATSPVEPIQYASRVRFNEQNHASPPSNKPAPPQARTSGAELKEIALRIDKNGIENFDIQEACEFLILLMRDKDMIKLISLPIITGDKEYLDKIIDTFDLGRPSIETKLRIVNLARLVLFQAMAQRTWNIWGLYTEAHDILEEIEEEDLLEPRKKFQDFLSDALLLILATTNKETCDRAIKKLDDKIKDFMSLAYEKIPDYVGRKELPRKQKINVQRELIDITGKLESLKTFVRRCKEGKGPRGELPERFMYHTSPVYHSEMSATHAPKLDMEFIEYIVRNDGLPEA